MEVRRVDDQRVALPPPDRIAGPLPDLRRQMRHGAPLGLHPHHARVVDHLDQDHDVVLGLDDRLVVVVAARERRRGAGEPHDATLLGQQRLRTVEGSGSVPVEPECRAVVLAAHYVGLYRGRTLRRALGHRWKTTVRWIDQNRSAKLAVHREGLGARVEPEEVVAADVAGTAVRSVATLGRRLAIRIAGLGCLLDSPSHVALDPRDLLLAEIEVVAVAFRPLERGNRRGVVVTREIRTAAGRARYPVAGRGDSGMEAEQKRDGPQGSDDSPHTSSE